LSPVFGRLPCVKIESAQAKYLMELYEADTGRYLEVARRTPVSTIPELVAAWADDESRVRWEGMGDSSNVMVEGEYAGSRFRCDNGHFPRAAAGKFLRDGCDVCRRAPKREKHFVARTEIAPQWHPERNDPALTPENVVVGSKRKIWWRTQCCGYEWEATPNKRLRGATWPAASRARLCPKCETVLNSLAWINPEVAAQWSPSNPTTPLHVTPAGTTTFKPEWICPEGHVWTATLAQRNAGMMCPDCYQWGKSQVELAHHAAAVEIFGAAESGALLCDDEFVSRDSWRVDISFAFAGAQVVVEYDGVYWHLPADKQAVDRRKSLDLIAASYTVVRLREEGLPALSVDGPRYREYTVSPSKPRPGEVISEIRDWLEATAV